VRETQTPAQEFALATKDDGGLNLVGPTAKPHDEQGEQRAQRMTPTMA